MRHTNLYCPACRQTTEFVEESAFFECRRCHKHLVKARPSDPGAPSHPLRPGPPDVRS